MDTTRSSIGSRIASRLPILSSCSVGVGASTWTGFGVAAASGADSLGSDYTETKEDSSVVGGSVEKAPKIDSRATIGGQAVLEGVMIRGEQAWAVAARKPSGEIETVRHDLPRLVTKWRFGKLPLIRGVLVLFESLSIGIRALSWSAQIGTAEEEKPLTKGSIVGSMTLALVFFSTVFILAPALVARVTAGGTDLGFNLVEAVVRLGLFIGYIWLIGRSSDIRRVFEFHGAEHMSIHAYEAGVPLTSENVKKFSPAHPRCGTSFLLVVVVLSIVVFSLLGRPGWLWLIGSRILLIPVIAAVAYELLRFAGLSRAKWLTQILSAPGLWLQKLTTGYPAEDQIEVAKVALLSALTAEQFREVKSRGGLVIPAGVVLEVGESG